MTLSITFAKTNTWGMKFHLAIRTENPINPAKDHTQLWANNWRSKSFKIFNFSSGIFYYRLFHRERNWGWTHTACFSLGYFVSESKEWRGFVSESRSHSNDEGQWRDVKFLSGDFWFLHVFLSIIILNHCLGVCVI